MKVRNFLYLILATLLFIYTVIPVQADTPLQGASDTIIRQVLSATARDLGWNETVTFKKFETGPPHWKVNECLSVYEYDSNATAIENVKGFQLLNAQSNTGEQFFYHGYFGYSYFYGFDHIFLAVDQYMIVIYEASHAKGEVALDTFYKNALAYGFMQAEASPGVLTTPMLTMIPDPAITITPVQGTSITLNASAQGYALVEELIDNGDNFGTISISGRITDQVTGSPISAATVMISSGANAVSVLSAADGSYSLTAVIPGGSENGQSGGVDFALPPQTNVTIEINPNRTELLADGLYTSDLTILVKDVQGNPIQDRELLLDASADAGPGTIQPARAFTDANGIIYATYTSFKPETDVQIEHPRIEVTLNARDAATGLVESTPIYVNQYQLTVLQDQYIPACLQCDFPSEILITVSDPWFQPIPDTPLSLEIAGLQSDATLVSDPSSNISQQELSLTTDTKGQARVYFKWQGNLDITEEERTLVIIDQITHARAVAEIKVHGLDLAIARVAEAGFTGVTGQEAFFKVYIKELLHPDLALERFNAASPNKLKLHVMINQYHSDGPNTSFAYESNGGWEQDELGTYVKMFTTPHMPFIIPVNDGTSWYEMRVDAVIDDDVYLPDLNRSNNDSMFALTTGSPDGWLHIWLQDGILTPRNTLAVIVKCVVRFMPGFGDALTVIDTLNQAYNLDTLGLSQSNAQVLTEALQKRVEKASPGMLTKLKASALNNVVSCAQDAYGFYKQSGWVEAPVLTACTRMASPVPFSFTQAEQETIELAALQHELDQFVHGFIMADPGQQAVILFGIDASALAVADAEGQPVDVSENLNTENGVAVFLFQEEDRFTLQIDSANPLEVALYQAGSGGERETLRYGVQDRAPLNARLEVGAGADQLLHVDEDGDGVADLELPARYIRHDVVRPAITQFTPADGAVLSSGDVTLSAAFEDNPGGSGIDPQAVQIVLDGINRTEAAMIQAGSLSLPLQDLDPGEHMLQLFISDMDGNAAMSMWSFKVRGNYPFSLNSTTLGYVIGGVMIVFLLGGIFLTIFLVKTKRRSDFQNIPMQAEAINPVHDQQGAWWYQDPASKQWFTSVGNGWQTAQNTPIFPGTQPAKAPSPAPPALPYRKASQNNSRISSCLLTLLIIFIMGVLVFSAVSLVAFQFIPGFNISPLPGVALKDILLSIGGGILVGLLGLFMLQGGLRSVVTKRAIETNEWGHRREKHGCSAVISGILSAVLGLLLLTAGLLLVSISVYQHLLPWLGFY